MFQVGFRVKGLGLQGKLVRLLPIVSIVVPFWGYHFRILNIELVKPKKGTTMETIGSTLLGFRPFRVEGPVKLLVPHLGL